MRWTLTFELMFYVISGLLLPRRSALLALVCWGCRGCLAVGISSAWGWGGVKFFAESPIVSGISFSLLHCRVLCRFRPSCDGEAFRGTTMVAPGAYWRVGVHSGHCAGHSRTLDT